MTQFILAALVAFSTQIASQPTDEQVIAALPKTETLRTDLVIVKSPIRHPAVTQDARHPVAHQWACVVYYTEIVNDLTIRRVQVVYLDGK